MKTLAPPVLPDSRRETLRILLLVQVAIFFVSLFEAAVASLLFPGPIGVVGNTIAIAALMWFIWAAGRGRSPRSLVWFERSLLVWFLLDTALSLGLAHRPLELVPTLTRLVLPLAILSLVKRTRP
jgi:hypothetical protein